MSQFNGIDISSYQGKPDWKKIKNAGIKIAILRAHQKYGIDESFEHNYAGATANDILVGAYKFSYAMNEAESTKEAEATLKVLNGRKLDCPVFLDLEYENQYNLSNKVIEKIALAFLNRVEKDGYSVGIYCNVDWYNNKLTDTLKKYPLWLAAYPFNDTGVIVERLRPKAGIGWQYSSQGQISGISGVRFDMDVFYTDFQTEKKSSKKKKKSTTEETATPPAASPSKGVTAEDVLNKARSWIGRNESAGTHKYIIDLYNSHSPLARGYKVQYTDQWCDTCLSALYIALDAVDLIGGTECGVEEHIKIFKQKGIWIEDGTITPKPAYIICYNWDKGSQPNDGYSDHIGIVESVDTVRGVLTCIEGNYKDSVSRREIPIGWGYIRGYAAPNYADVSAIQEKAKEQAKQATSKSLATAGNGLNKEPQWVGAANVDDLNVRVYAGLLYSNIQSYPRLNKGNLVDICDTVNDAHGEPWYYVRIAGQYYGFVKASFIDRV